MAEPSDIAVYSSDNKLQLVVEVKNKKGATPEWATKMRKNLLAHSLLPDSPYFLLALPDRFYLWKNTGLSVDTKSPDYMEDSKMVLESYLHNSSYRLDTMSEYGLVLIINAWLDKLVNANLDLETARPQESWLFDSGLYDAIKRGHVKTEAPV
jgi:hypothetical protein